MTSPDARGTTLNSRFINASPDAIYDAFLDPAALVVWLAPANMTGVVHRFDGRVGGGYEMSLYYSEAGAVGKTAAREDRFTARFVELTPPARIIEAVTFDSDDPAFAGEMIMTVTLEAAEAGTSVSILFTGIPPGIRPEDNEAGTESTLEKLARYVE
jgi:uncharacterized protein YndB with AHSA1/START domain